LYQVIEDHVRLTIKTYEESIIVLKEDILRAAEIIINAIDNCKKIVIMGNGGSAADASHMAAELVGRFSNNSRRPLPVIALTTDTSIITAISNDFSFDEVFVRQCRALVQPDDVAIAISTSGNSKNIILALDECRKRAVRTILLTGKDGGKAAKLADLSIKVPSSITPIIQEVHRTVIHILCSIIDDYYGKE
jgi:D-sedoheptulose 7-phosphate isomerase